MTKWSQTQVFMPHIKLNQVQKGPDRTSVPLKPPKIRYKGPEIGSQTTSNPMDWPLKTLDLWTRSFTQVESCIDLKGLWDHQDSSKRLWYRSPNTLDWPKRPRYRPPHPLDGPKRLRYRPQNPLDKPDRLRYRSLVRLNRPKRPRYRLRFRSPDPLDQPERPWYRPSNPCG